MYSQLLKFDHEVVTTGGRDLKQVQVIAEGKKAAGEPVLACSIWWELHLGLTLQPASMVRRHISCRCQRAASFQQPTKKESHDACL